MAASRRVKLSTISGGFTLVNQHLTHYIVIVVTTVIQLHCGYHSYLTKLYVGSALVSAMYGWSS